MNARAELLHVLMLPDLERAERIGEFWPIRRAAPSPRLIDRDEKRTLRAVLVGVLREGTFMRETGRDRGPHPSQG